MPEDPWGEDEEVVAETIRNAALRYATMGWKIIPIHGMKLLGDGRWVCDCAESIQCGSPGKHPYELDWTHRYYSSGEEICEIFDHKYPNANLGVVTGKCSGIWVLDVDTYKGGGQALATVMAQAGDLLVAGRVHRSGRGGEHHFFVWPYDEAGFIKSRSDVFWRDCGVDVRGDRGFIVLPPSRSAHGPYTESHTNYIPKAPAWLLDWVTRRSKVATAAPLPTAEEIPPLAGFSSLLLDLMGDLDAVPRYRRLWRIVCAARQCGFTIGQAYALCLQWVQENQIAHPEVPGKWQGPAQAQCVAADVSRNWSKLDAERAGLELALPFSIEPDADEVATVVAELAASGGVAGGPIDWERIRRRLPDLEAVARDIATSAEEVVDWDRLEEALPPPQWIVPHLIERGAYTLVYAREGAGKSLVLQQQMGAAVAGQIIEGHPDLSVLYLDMENDFTDLHERFNAAGLKPEQLRRLTYRLVDEALAFNSPAGAVQLLGRVYHHRPDVVVIDTMTRFLDGEQNAPEAPNAFFKLAVKPLTAAGIAVVVLDHMAKDERVRGPIGSKAKTTAPHVVWRMERREDNSLLLELEKNRKGHCPPYLLATQKSEPLDFAFTPMTREEYAAQCAREFIGRNNGDDPSPHKRGRGRPPVDDEAKIFDLVLKLDGCDVPLDASVRQAIDALKEAGISHNRTYVAQALKRRREDEEL